jgi:peptidoglycan L-alanyl-D-glutamate endopeptidase CwlK
MSTLFTDDTVFLQRMLRSAGCYTGALNGVWSQAVETGDERFLSLTEQVARECGTFDPRSERNIRSLHPEAQKAARQFLIAARAAGFDVRVISGTRTYAEQNALYAIGRRGDTRKVVTNARGGQSNHNFGVAWDIGLFDGGKYITASRPYEAVAKYCPPGVEWGGNWKTFRDLPHYQLALNKSLSAVRACFEEGKPLITRA